MTQSGSCWPIIQPAIEKEGGSASEVLLHAPGSTSDSSCLRAEPLNYRPDSVGNRYAACYAQVKSTSNRCATGVSSILETSGSRTSPGIRPSAMRQVPLLLFTT